MKIHVCPMCGSALEGTIHALPLTSTQLEILKIITQGRGRYISTPDLIYSLYINREEPEQPENALRSQIYKIRKELGDIIESRRTPGLGGYRLKETEIKKYSQYFKDVKHVAQA